MNPLREMRRDLYRVAKLRLQLLGIRPTQQAIRKLVDREIAQQRAMPKTPAINLLEQWWNELPEQERREFAADAWRGMDDSERARLAAEIKEA